MSTQYPGGFITKSPVVPSGPYETSTASGIWTVDQALQYTKQGIWPTAGRLVPDPQFNYVTMLLNGNGTNAAQNNTFIDSSTNNLTLTRNGNTSQGSYSPFGSNWSNNFSTTSGNYLTIANNAAFTLGSTFTVECWVYRTASNDGTIVGRWYGGGSDAWLMHIYNTGKLAFGMSSSGSYANSSVASIPLNTWTHVAVSNNTTSKRFYINGVLDSTFASDDINSLGTINLTICQNTGGGNGITAYISNLRIVKGTALYTSNFTPSTTPLTAVSGTSLLTCQSNRFIDNSTNNFAITVTGAPTIQRFNPFGTAAAYSTSVIGGSGYFDGNGDSLATPSGTTFNFGSNSLTIEMWINTTSSESVNRYTTLYSKQPAAYSTGMWAFMINSASSTAGDVAFYSYEFSSSAALLTTTGVDIRDGAWHHIALVRNGSSWVIYVDGISRATATWAGSIANLTAPTYIGQDQNYSRFFTGYISNLRVVNGTAVYTAAFTPPTAPLTAITNTALLTNFTNGAIFDSAMMNGLETSGSAQLSTSVVKYGTASMYFISASNSSLLTPGLGLSGQSVSLRAGNFTIETWIYPTAVSGSRAIIDYRTTGADTNGFFFGLNGTSLQIYCQGVLNTTVGTISINAWSHVACVRSSGTITIYINGVSAGSAANTSNWTNNTASIGGSTRGATEFFSGYMDQFRITLGYARYTATFTPPTAAFPTIGPN